MIPVLSLRIRRCRNSQNNDSRTVNDSLVGVYGNRVLRQTPDQSHSEAKFKGATPLLRSLSAAPVVWRDEMKSRISFKCCITMHAINKIRDSN